MEHVCSSCLPISPIFRSLLIACFLLPSAVAVGECEVENDDSAGLLQTISYEAVKKNNADATNKTQRTPQVAFTRIQEAALSDNFLDMFGALPSQHLVQASQGAPPSAQDMECAETTLLLQRPKPRVFAHQERQPPSLASQHIERTASASISTMSGSNLRLAIFMTTAFSRDHQRFFNCWEYAIQKFKFLRDADLMLHAPRQLLPDELAKFQQMRNITVRVSDTTTGGQQAGAIKSFKEAFGSKGFQEGWFKDYDWVIRLNPDVLFMDDSWILDTMQNSSIDGIFQKCVGCRINTDFFAVRPKAVDFASVEKSHGYLEGVENAEQQATQAFKNILASGRHAWLEGGIKRWGKCRVLGRESPVVHNHSLRNFCPGYLGQRRQQANDDGADIDMGRCDFV